MPELQNLTLRLHSPPGTDRQLTKGLLVTCSRKISAKHKKQHSVLTSLSSLRRMTQRESWEGENPKPQSLNMFIKRCKQRESHIWRQFRFQSRQGQKFLFGFMLPNFRPDNEFSSRVY